MFEFEKIAINGRSYARDNGGTCYQFPNEDYFRVIPLTEEKRAKGYRVYNACADLVTIPRECLGGIENGPALDDRDVVTVTYQFVTRAKTERGIIDAAARKACELGPWCYIPACVAAVWGNGFDIVKDVKLVAYSRLER